MAAPFELTTLSEEEGWDPLNDAPVVALHNRLAEAEVVTNVTKEDLAALEAEYRISFNQEFPARLEELYAVFLAACLADKQFTQEEVTAVWHLKWLLDISDERHTALYRRVATEVYLRSVDEVMGDFTVSEQEQKFLTQLGEYLDLPADLRNLAFDTRAQMMLHDAFDVAAGDGELTDQELEQLRVLQKQLGKNLALDEQGRAAYQRARLIWVIKNAARLEPLVDVPLQLRANEECYYRQRASFLTLARRQDAPLRGEERRAKLATSAFWHTEVGEMPDDHKALDTGDVFLTNRHLYLAGRVHRSELGLHTIQDVDACPAWVDIRYEGGRMLRLMMTKNAEIFAHYLARVLREM